MLTKYTLKTKILQLLFLFGIGVIYTSCTKTIIAPNPVIKPVPVPPTATADLRDTLANLASVFYLWNNNIPANIFIAALLCHNPFIRSAAIWLLLKRTTE